MIKKIFTIIVLFVVCIALTIALYTYSSRTTYIKNGFERSFFTNKLIYAGRANFDSDKYSIIDITPNFIYLFDTKMPYKLLDISLDLKKQTMRTIPFPIGIGKIEGRNKVALIDSTYFLLNGKTSTAYRISKDLKTKSKSLLDSLYFYQSTVVDSNKFIFVTIKQSAGQNKRIIEKKDWKGNSLAHYSIDKQPDGIFSTDGLFSYDKRSNLLIYMFFYSGEFTCLDTNFNVIYKAKTVDTITHANISLQSLRTDFKGKTVNAITTKTSPKVVNRRLAINNGKIFVQSYLKADNETMSEFKNSDVIDTYNIKDGSYLESFYLPRLQGQKLSEFKVYDNKIFAVYGNSIVVFKFPNSSITSERIAKN